MRLERTLIAPASILVVWLSASIVPAQSASTAMSKQAQQEAQKTYSEASLKFDILESQLQTLRKKMQLQAKRKAEQTKAWNEHYETVKRHIEAWDSFVDSYSVE